MCGGVAGGGGGGRWGVTGVALFSCAWFSRLELTIPGVHSSIDLSLSDVFFFQRLPLIHCGSVSGCLDSTKCHPAGE